MSTSDDLLSWASRNDIRCDGFKLVQTPGRGTGVFADRRIEAGEVILEVPVKMMRNIDSVPRGIRDKLPPRWSIHSSLAVDLCFNQIVAPWQAILPTIDDFRNSLPLMWPPQVSKFILTDALGYTQLSTMPKVCGHASINFGDI
ncbi:hypothetical protein PFICI_15070 [Pestalotiopsis fici W106-1]|uniref:SET domain-containing protein n=1 Tax=Pestalotiopsis fici (strain W106-1 / CGMCC3.15140) TaxID=1229662 RepID=W3WGS6_PESFW|nr:uncharacterized protein PFICI_15070 [Pestalotiopsis fici W106-1]ETS73125.1 hypothetical protein PFICI_15070 [Pestalotiopsis fici W106-1]